jgi:hypothetical protein
MALPRAEGPGVSSPTAIPGLSWHHGYGSHSHQRPKLLLQLGTVTGFVVWKVDLYPAQPAIFYIEAETILARVALQQIVDPAQALDEMLQVLSSGDADVEMD